MENEQQIPWERIPLKVQQLAQELTTHKKFDVQLEIANKIMAAVKLELEKAYDAGYDQADSYETESPRDFETWYKNTYNK